MFLKNVLVWILLHCSFFFVCELFDFFGNSFIKVQLTYPPMHPFKVYD